MCHSFSLATKHYLHLKKKNARYSQMKRDDPTWLQQRNYFAIDLPNLITLILEYFADFEVYRKRIEQTHKPIETHVIHFSSVQVNK